MASDLDIGWLAGILDGEGSLGVYWANKAKGHKTGGNIYAEVRIEATSFAMLSKVARILDDLSIVHRMWVPPRLAQNATRSSYRLAIYRSTDVIKCLNIVRPALAVKAAEADAIIKWYERWPDQRGRKATDRATYEEKVAFYDEAKRLKRVA
jgi:hypothetical protein